MANGEICRWGEGQDRRALGRSRKADRDRRGVYRAEWQMWAQFPSRTFDSEEAAERLFHEMRTNPVLQEKYPHADAWAVRMVVDNRLRVAAGSFNPHTGVVKLRPSVANPFILAHEYAHFVEMTDPSEAELRSDGFHGKAFRAVCMDVVEVMYGPDVREALFENYKSEGLQMQPDPDHPLGIPPPPLACAHGLWHPQDAELSAERVDPELAEARRFSTRNIELMERDDRRKERRLAAAMEERRQQQPRCGYLMPRARKFCQRPAGHSGPHSSRP